jgi:hypothetical protein
MRGALGFSIVFGLTSVACGRNAPLQTVKTGAGTGGTHPIAGSAGHGGSMSGDAGATVTGIAGASAGPGTAGSSPVGATGQGGASGGSALVMCGAPTLPNGNCVLGAFKENGGVCRCQDIGACVCPGVGCVDPSDNCGACGVHCGPTSTCNDGVCGPAPVMVSPAIAGCNDAPLWTPIRQISAMTIAATDAVYFTDAVHGTVNRAGTVTPLAMNEMGATMIQQVGTNLYWYAYGAKEIRKMATSGGPVTDVYTVTLTDGGAPPDVAGFLVTPDGLNLYISLAHQVLEAPVAGGASTVVASEVEGYPGALALDGATYIVYPVPLNGVVDAALLGTMPALCSAGFAMISTTCTRLGPAYDVFPNFVAVIAGRAYWIENDWVNSELIGPTRTQFDVIATAQAAITAAAMTTEAIYFADADPSDPMHGFIEKTALAPSSTPTLLARGQGSPIAIAVDATKVYWATSDCAIWSQPR